MKPIMNYIEYCKTSIKKNRQNTNVTITWSDAISVDDFKKDQLSKLKRGIVRTVNVIYIFIGEKASGGKGADVGQTTRPLDVRTSEHLRDGDYLEGFPKNQNVYCGKVSAGLSIDRQLLEQIEGVIIQHLAEKKGYQLCNDPKTHSYSQPYAIGHIENKNRKGDIITLLPPYLPIKD